MSYGGVGHRKKIMAMLAGREDVKAEFALLNTEQLERVFSDFFPSEPGAAARFSQLIGDEQVSMVYLYALFQ